MFEQEAMCKKDKCSIRTSMEEEDKVGEEEADLAKADITKNKPENTISTINKMCQTCDAERLEEGGAIMPAPADKTIPPHADTVANSASMRQSVTKRRVSRPPQVDNSPDTPQTPTTTIVAECL